MFRLLPKIPLPHILRPGPEPIDDGFALQPLDRGLESRVRTLAGKAGISPEITDRLAAGYVAADAAARVEVSRPDQVQGLRRVVLMGPAYHRPNLSVSIGTGSPVRRSEPGPSLTFIAVTRDGRLFRRGLLTDEGCPSPREGMRIARFEPERLLSGIEAADPGLNRYNGAGSATVKDAVDELLGQTLADLTREERSALPYSFIMGLEHVTRSRISRRIGLARYALNDAIERDLLRMMRGCALQSMEAAEWVCGAVDPEPGHPGRGRWFGVALDELHDRDLSRARVQAVRAYPALAKKFATEPKLREAVDARAPLAPVIADYLHVDVAGVKLLNGVTWQMAGVMPNDPCWGLTRLAEVPPDLRPARRAEHRQIPLISSFSILLDEPLGETMRRFARGGSPYRFGDDLKRVSPADVRDAAEYLVDKLLLPGRLRAIRDNHETTGSVRTPFRVIRDAMTKEVLRPMTPRALFEFSDRWHRNFERHEDRLRRFRSREAWTGLTGQLELAPGITARELTSADALQRQGRREGHCVGGYTENVLRGRPDGFRLIFSIETGTEILGTAEIKLRSRPEGDGREALVLQNRSRRNADVSPAAERAAEVLCRELELWDPDRISEYLTELGRVRSRRSRERALPEHVRNAGYDVWDDEALETAWDELSGYLPRGVRKGGLDGLISSERARLPAGSPFQPGETPFWVRDAQLVADYLEKQEAALPVEEREPCGLF